MKKLIAFLMVICLLLISGCTVGTSNPSPTAVQSPVPELGIWGEVTRVEYLPDGRVRLLVENGDPQGYDKASVTAESSIIQDPQGKRPYGILVGDMVEAVFDGPVAESYPIQANAKSIEIVKYQDLKAGSNGIAGAYYAVMKILYDDDTALNDKIEMIAIDASKAELSQYDRMELLTLAQNFGFEVSEDTFEGLQEKGLIKELYLEKGLLFHLETLQNAETTIHIKADKWRSGDGAIGSEFAVSKGKDGWTITETSGFWIS